MSKGGYKRLYRKYLEREAEISELQALLRLRQEQSLKSALQEESVTNVGPELRFTERIFRFLEHNAFLAALGIVGPLMVPVSSWFLAAPAACLVLALHRAGTVKGKVLSVQIGAYISVLCLGALAGFGLHKAVIRTEEDLVQRIAHLLPPAVTNIYQGKLQSPENGENRQVESLRDRTLNLSTDLYDWAVEQEGTINSWNQQAMAQALVDTIQGNQSGASAFNQRLAASAREAEKRFFSYYWPKVSSIQDELRAAGVDTTPLSHAEASKDPLRSIPISLSVLANRIGKKGPFPREITPLEIKLFIHQIQIPNVQIYAYLTDANSRRVAETIRSGFAHQKEFSVNSELYPLIAEPAIRHGLWIVYPSADWTSDLNGFLPALDDCQLESNWEVRPMKQPPSIIKIEVWPETPNWRPTQGPTLTQ